MSLVVACPPKRVLLRYTPSRAEGTTAMRGGSWEEARGAGHGRVHEADARDGHDHAVMTQPLQLHVQDLELRGFMLQKTYSCGTDGEGCHRAQGQGLCGRHGQEARRRVQR